jgi:phage gp36-like protein
MPFLIKADLNTVATTEVRDLITNTNDAIVDQIIIESIDMMRSYLHRYYDVDIIFSAIGEARSNLILKYLKDIVIHEVYTRRSRDLNEVAKLRYDEAMLWLDKVAAAKIDPDLPRLNNGVDDDGNPQASTFMKLGSRKGHANHW